MEGIILSIAISAALGLADFTLHQIVRVGVALVVALSCSSSLGDVIASRAEGDFIKRERAREEWELDVNPQGCMFVFLSWHSFMTLLSQLRR
jgi:hypothetical protein